MYIQAIIALAVYTQTLYNLYNINLLLLSVVQESLDLLLRNTYVLLKLYNIYIYIYIYICVSIVKTSTKLEYYKNLAKLYF